MADTAAASVASCFCPSRQSKFSITKTRNPPSKCTVSRKTSPHFGEFHQRLIGPAQKAIERRLAADGQTKRQEMERQENRQRRGRTADAPWRRATACRCDVANAARSLQHQGGDGAKAEHRQQQCERERELAGAALVERRPFGQNVAHADRGVNGNGGNENPVITMPKRCCRGCATEYRRRSILGAWHRR